MTQLFERKEGVTFVCNANGGVLTYKDHMGLIYQLILLPPDLSGITTAWTAQLEQTKKLVDFVDPSVT